MVATYIEGFHDPEEVARMCYTPLGNTGMELSSVGFGASPLGNPYTAEAPSDAEGQACVLKALKSGINYIDTAPWYGQGKSEEKLGKILEDIPRSSYYIGTKVGRYEKDVEGMFDFSAERVKCSVDESLSRLGLRCVDIIQVHDVEFAENVEIILNETLPALQKIKEAGKARFIGITGYPISTLREIVERSTVKIDSVLSYCHLDLNDSSLLDHIAYFEQKGIGVISASPLSMALLTSFGPPDWHPASDEVKASCRNAAQYCQDHGVDIAKLAIHFSFSQAKVATVLVGMDRPSFLERNLDVVHNKLSETEEKVLQEIQKEFFPPGVSRTWEGVEVAKYRKKLKARQAELLQG
ncbi:L-galactose dehydrogenase [Strongylocentrotus purpuratus]|uniref:NADP-dependent oxidoreductase domain-containing protein n=1 Tax=Strongylocentrotus purpuratus TaxID=7668 RepID=A0A7M7RCW7_STRPU|nr:L-galactose dehydrogenase [Strongylocentrotus purpuratus]XP_782704.1 L-galactose dehydrogenase [Strongylocentrotus purpuratus]|eukprot:XP_003724450.1 PREDICTED: L-galactose dehydrogenase [Strongylocentrotus purpuratus]